MHVLYSISPKAAVPVVWPRVKLQSSVFWTHLPRNSLFISLALPVSMLAACLEGSSYSQSGVWASAVKCVL